ncbi:MAG: cytochrome c-type biogenesis protein CcmH [Gemmatimonadaceae bacterium]
MTSRRDFLRRAGTGAAAMLVGAEVVGAQRQQRGAIHDSTIVRDSTNLFAMDQMAEKPVRLPPKPGAVPSMNDGDRDDLERRIHCQCGCTLDVFTCRTTDFSCRVSPAMHRDVIALVNGGYSAQEIIDAFVGVYGERALMAPKKSGFDLLAWVTPGVVVLIAAVLVSMWLRRRGRPSQPTGAVAPAPKEWTAMRGVDATPEELARLEAAVKGDDEA